MSSFPKKYLCHRKFEKKRLKIDAISEAHLSTIGGIPLGLKYSFVIRNLRVFRTCLSLKVIPRILYGTADTVGKGWLIGTLQVEFEVNCLARWTAEYHRALFFFITRDLKLCEHVRV